MKKLLLLGTAVAAGVLIKRWLETPRLAVDDPSDVLPTRALEHGEPVFGLVRTSGADEALGILARFDEHQVECARAALERDLDDATLGLAERMRKEHEDHLEEARARAEERQAEPDQFVSVSHFDARCSERLEALRALPDEGFASEYLERVADEHAAMMKVIDDALLPGVADPTLRELLRRHRAHLKSHLSEARMLH